MSAVVTGDLHLTTNPQDDYRWQFFFWLAGLAEHHDELILLGDYTNPKDNHPAALVNQFVDAIDLCSKYKKIIMIAGNHDFIDPDCPFFMFLNSDKVAFIKEPKDLQLSIGHCLFVPAASNWSTLNIPKAGGLSWSEKDVPKLDYIFTHATFDGAISETGHKLTGVPPKIVEEFGIPVISGDIHKPQKIGKLIEYVGSPYHTRFGGDYKPHVMFIDNGGNRTYRTWGTAPRKVTHVISSLDDLAKLNKNDQHKIRVKLSRGELSEWPKIQQEIKNLAQEDGWNLSSVELILNQEENVVQLDPSEVRSPEQMVEDYAKRHDASERHIEVGKSLL